MTPPLPNTAIYLGTTYYPEQWPAEQWAEDILLMKQSGINVVRMGDTAWAALEPTEGKHAFAWMHNALDQFAEANIAVILATPTAAPPLWMTTKYPDMLAIQEDGKRVLSENRSPACITSPELYKSAANIVKMLVKHFGSHPAVIGWQVDNALQRVCYCERCHQSFKQFMKEKYKNLEEVNIRLSGMVRSQKFTDWDQIPLPIGRHHPGLMLEYKRFTTHNYQQFLNLQWEIIRPAIPENIWITHNFQGLDSPLDAYPLAKILDQAGLDWYIGRGQHDYHTSTTTLAFARGLKQKNFWVMEAQPGNVNWASISNTLDQGAVRSMTWHAVAHGSDAVLFWHWRTAKNNVDQFHGSLLNTAGAPRLILDEVSQIGSDFAAMQDLMQDTHIESEVAILNSPESRWSIDFQSLHRDFTYTDYLLHFTHPLAEANINYDVISAESSLQKYKLVIAPALTILNKEQIATLTEFVKRGGHLVVTARSGVKDMDNSMETLRPPAGLLELTGVVVEEAYALAAPVPIKANYFDGNAKIWAERLHPLDENSVPIARYGVHSNGWLNNQLAMTVRPFGKGLVYYVGCWLDDTSQQVFINRLLNSALIFSIKTPYGVSVSVRQKKDGKKVFFVINHTSHVQKFKWPWYAHEHLSNSEVDGTFEMKSYGVAILTQSKKTVPPEPATTE